MHNKWEFPKSEAGLKCRIKTHPLTTENLINSLLTKNETSDLINIIKLMNTSM
jgi:hypothetical protein